jgi:two-component system repressor protein LuxO
LVSATNRDPLVEVREGRMRSDLYYRLHVVPIQLPTLRERRGDVQLLATYALRESSNRHGKNFDSIEPAALDRLAQCSWPGNVRQLFNAIERCVVLNKGPVLTLEMLPGDLEYDDAVAPIDESTATSTGAEGESSIFPLADLEKRAIAHALSVCKGSASEAARLLGISPATVYRKIKSYGL